MCAMSVRFYSAARSGAAQRGYRSLGAVRVSEQHHIIRDYTVSRKYLRGGVVSHLTLVFLPIDQRCKR
jgi:hypothetical protein